MNPPTSTKSSTTGRRAQRAARTTPRQPPAYDHHAMRRLQILMDEELDDALERMARQTKRSKSDLVREFVRARVRPLPPIEEDPLWEMIGVDDVEPASVDDVVYPR
ncbi:MAG: ribbon-helix-helix protein, CopG family [Dehalococcoidia bacterium]|nr:ribbon-helix-helix protein, CopG family [Dehalococcoidia bacterium]